MSASEYCKMLRSEYCYLCHFWQRYCFDHCCCCLYVCWQDDSKCYRLLCM